jgi:hypothetical protein
MAPDVDDDKARIALWSPEQRHAHLRKRLPKFERPTDLPVVGGQIKDAERSRIPGGRPSPDVLRGHQAERTELPNEVKLTANGSETCGRGASSSAKRRSLSPAAPAYS